MTNKILYSVVFLMVLNFSTKAFAQEVPVEKWDLEKIRGTRYLPYVSYTGFPFLSNSWVQGSIELRDGVVIDSLNIRYSSFKDEVIYYNQAIGSQIVIDKFIMNGFSFTDPDGEIRVFRKQNFENYGKGDHFFEVLSDGEPKLLALRKVSLETTEPYKEENGILKNLIYKTTYSYYFYSPKKGYSLVRMNLSSLLSKFDKGTLKTVKKLLRKNRIIVSDETSFMNAWRLIEKGGYKIIF